MNIDTTIRTPTNNVGDLQDVVTAPFLGFMVASVLFGAGILQAYQYYLNYAHDSRARKLTIAVVCISDSVHFCSSANMVYTSLIKGSGYASPEAIRSIKVMVVARSFLTILVQSFYLYLIWNLSGNILLTRQLSRAVKCISFMTFIYALGIVAVFIAYAMQISSLSHFSVSFERMIYLGYLSTAVIDSGIAFIMTLVLFKSKSPSTVHGGAVPFLVSFFVGTGLLTAVASILTIILYVSHRKTVLYLATEFPTARLYTNSILAMFNAKSRLKKNMDALQELRIPSAIFFGDPVNDSAEEVQNSSLS